MSASTTRSAEKKHRARSAFLISLVVLIVCTLVNWGVITGWGNVKLSRLSISGDDSLTYSALMYVPQNATNNTPAPAILMLHGNSGNARNHESWAVEFARRGYVVLSVDNLGAGDGEYSSEAGINAVPSAFADYLFDLPFVDPERVIVSGHSSGATNAAYVANNYPVVACTLSNGRAQEFFTADHPYTGNLLWVTSDADKMNTEEAVLTQAKLVFVNNGVMEDAEQLQVGTVYGAFEDGNATSLVNIPGQVHEGAFVDSNHIAALLDFVQQAVEPINYISSGDQIWMWKDVMGLVCMFAFVITLLNLAVLFVEEAPLFASIKQPLPRNIGMRRIPLAISITVALVFPVLCLYTGSFGLVGLFGSTTPNLGIFQVRFTNIALPIVIGLNLFGLLMFFVYHFTWGKKDFHANLRDYGLTSEGSSKIDLVLIGKSALLAILVAVIGWCYLGIQNDLLGTDFYCLFFGYKPIALYKLIYYIPYIVLWVCCFAIASLGMNVERRLPSTGNETADTLIAVIFNALLATGTITIMVIVENAIQLSIGTTGTALATWKTDITRLWGMPVGMFMGGMGNTYLFRKTGNIWTGAILMGIICALGSCLYGQIQF